jgi:DNA segregation ATPase FtsK/SpoIIIE-like protein
MTTVPMPQPDIVRLPRPVPWFVRVLQSLMRILRLFFPRPLTAEEKLEQQARQRLKRALDAKWTQLDREACHYADTISRTLANYGVAAIDKVQGKREVRRYVRYRDKYYANEERIHLRVDTRPGKLPFGIGLDRLEDPEVLRLLSINCRHQVRSRWSEDGGFWLVIDRKFGIGGLPTHVQFEEVMSLRPANARPLSIPLGCAERKKYPWKSFDNFYNMLVAGTVGSGKSRFLHSTICTLIRYNAPGYVQLMLIDLKGGVELDAFFHLPHVLQIQRLKAKKRLRPAARSEAEADETPGDETFSADDISVEMPDVDDGFEPAGKVMTPAIFDKREDVPAAFAWLIREGERRLTLLKGRHVTNIGQFNQHKPGSDFQHLSHIICLIDEWADVKLGPTGRQAEEMLINIASRFRAVGIHVVVCTQSPSKEVLGIRVRNVLPVRVVMQCPDVYMSQMLIGDQRAADINHPGRGFFVEGGRAMEIQLPFINDDTVKEYVAQACAGQVTGVQLKAHDVSDMEMLRWAYYENNGNLDVKSTYEKWKERRISHREVERFCARYQGKEFDLDGELFTVTPGHGAPNPIPRRIMPVKRIDTADAKQVV